MTRAFTPPESLSDDDVRTLRVVRRDMWMNSLQGLAFGSGSGFLLHTGAQWVKKLGYFPRSKLNRNTLMLSVLGGAAFGSFLFAVKTGKEEIHTLHPIFQVGSTKVPGDLDHQTYYEKTLVRAKERGDDLRALERSRLTDPHYHQQYLQQQQQSTAAGGGGGELDSFNKNDMEEMRVVRRKTLMDSIHNGQGLSDSHGGHWVDGQSK